MTLTAEQVLRAIEDAYLEWNSGGADDAQLIRAVRDALRAWRAR